MNASNGNNENVKVRKMVLNDVDAVYDIEVASFTTPWTKEAFENEIAKNQLAIYFVVSEAERIVGYVGMWTIVDELHITNVAIAPEFRGKGYSNALIQHVLEYALEHGFVAITLEVRASNKVAISLYEKYMFVATGIRKGYYQDTGEDAVVMWREF